jgi:hypothetical protein
MPHEMATSRRNQALWHASLSNMRISSPTPSEKPPLSVREGDFAEYVQRGVTSPGEVARPKQAPLGQEANYALQQIRHSPSRSAAGWVVSFATMGFLGSVSYLALKERTITLGGRNGSSFFEGSSAVVVGFLLLAGALLPIVQLARRTRFAKAVTLVAASVWLATVLYLAARFQ